jgi:hypothetical protein
VADFDDDFCLLALDGVSADDMLDLARCLVSLTSDDFAREDNAFEVEDREVVIFKLFSGMRRYGGRCIDLLGACLAAPFGSIRLREQVKAGEQLQKKRW